MSETAFVSAIVYEGWRSYRKCPSAMDI